MATTAKTNDKSAKAPETRESLARKYPIINAPQTVANVLRVLTAFVSFFVTLFYGYVFVNGFVYVFVAALMNYLGINGSPDDNVTAWMARVVAVIPAFLLAYILDHEIYARPFKKLAEISQKDSGE